MSSTIVVPDQAHNQIPSEISRQLNLVATAAKADIDALGSADEPFKPARGIAVANIAALASFAGVAGGTPNNGITYVAGERILLVAQTTAAENGLYTVGTVGGGVAPLTRVVEMAAGAAILQGTSVFVGSEPLVGADSLWIANAITGKLYATDDPLFTCIQARKTPALQARGVTIANIANRAAFTGVAGGAAINGITYVAGETVLLAAQTTAAENGLYVVGLVNAGSAPLFRAPDVFTGQPVVQGTTVFVGSESTVGANTKWTSTAITGKVYGTDDPKFVCDGGNFVAAADVTTIGATGAAPTNFFFAGAVLTAKRSGLFRVDVDLNYSSDTTAQAVTIALISDTSAAGALAGTNKVAHGIKGVSAGATGDIETMDTAGGANAITYNAAAWTTAPIIQKVTVEGELTGLLTTNGKGTNTFSFHGICHNANGTTKTPFAIGNTVGFGLKVTAGGGTLSFDNLNIQVTELDAA